MNVRENRITNGRREIEKAGGVSVVSRKMGYAKPSFLSQIFGPRGERPATESTARKLEQTLGLEPMSLDRDPPQDELLKVRTQKADATRAVEAVRAGIAATPSVTVTVAALDAKALQRSISLVKQMASDEDVTLSSERFANIITMAYEDSLEHGGEPRESKIRQIVQLLK